MSRPVTMTRRFRVIGWAVSYDATVTNLDWREAERVLPKVIQRSEVARWLRFESSDIVVREIIVPVAGRRGIGEISIRRVRDR